MQTNRRQACALVAALSSTLLAAPWAGARTPQIAHDAREGVWIAAGETFVHQTRDRWSVFPAHATVNEIAVDDNIVWVATDDGVIRFDSGSRHSTSFGIDEGFPSQAVATVAFDEQYVWFGTNKGLVRYRKIDQTFRVYDDEDGLPHRAVNDALAVGRQVWFATRAGIAIYDPDLDGFRGYTEADGLLGEDVSELYLVGDDLWCITDAGLTRLRLRTRAFTGFDFDDIGGEQLRTFVLDGDRVWVGTERGLFSFEPTSDTFQAFPQQSSLASASIVGVETFVDYLFIATEAELAQFHKPSRSIRRFSEADGLARHAGVTGTLLTGGLLTLIFEDGAEVYDIGRDLWQSRTLATTQQRPSTVRVFGKLDAEVPYDLKARDFSEDRHATTEVGLAFGQRYGKGRSLDATMRLDYGQIELEGIRDLEYKVEYLGHSGDLLREVRVQDKLEYRTLEEGLERTLLLEGARARVASPGEEPTVAGTVYGGRRRGEAVRDFLTGPRQEIYTLSKRYILPGSDRVYVDGELLTNGTDYTIIYPAGQIAFLDPERVDDLSIIEVEYEYDLVSKKGLGVLSLLDLLPGDREVGDWSRQGEARLISEETGLYQQIDGAAPKYIDRGWQRSVYVEYRQGSRTIQVAIHDMGDDVNARALYDYDLPPAREPVPDHEPLIIDVGLATSYAAKAYTESFYIELNIDEKSDAAKQSLKLFAIQILDRGDNAGAHSADVPRQWLASARAAVTPYSGMEFGARVVALRGEDPFDDAMETRRRRLAGFADARWERAFGSGGRVTAYGELGGASGGDDDPSGWAGMGRLRLSHPWLEGNLEGRHHSPGYRSIGTDATLLGRLRDEGRVSATAYPRRWLPTSLFFTRQMSETESGATGVVQHALARARLVSESLPTTSLQAGHTMVDDTVDSTSRLRLVGQTDYDLPASALRVLHFKRVALRALYGLSDATTESGGAFARGDRVHLVRLEGRVAPTATESAYALFRSREVERQTSVGGIHRRAAMHWELNSGARSAIVPGLIPQVNYTVFFDDDRERDEGDLTSAKSSVTAELGVYPGQYWSPLVPVAIIPRYSVANTEESENDFRTTFHRSHRFDNKAVYAGRRAIEVELYQLYERAVSGRTRDLEARKLELRHRFVYRPIYASPITLRLNYTRQRTRNDLSDAPEAPTFGRQTTSEAVLEWLMRWTRVWTTRLRGTYSRDGTDGWVMASQTGGAADVFDFTQHRVGAETELRMLTRSTTLFLIQRNRVAVLFGDGVGASDAIAYDIGGGVIWVLDDNLYLDSELVYRQTVCTSDSCAAARSLEPRVFLTFNL